MNEFEKWKKEVLNSMVELMGEAYKTTIKDCFEMLRDMINESREIEIKVNEDSARKLTAEERLEFISLSLDNLAKAYSKVKK